MDVGAVGGYDWEEQYYDQDGVFAISFKGKGMGKGIKGKGECYDWGATGNFSKECQHPNKGKRAAQPVGAPKTREPGAKEYTQEPGAREDT